MSDSAIATSPYQRIPGVRTFTRSVAATLGVAVVPTVVVFWVLVFGRSRPQLVLAVLLSVTLTGVAASLGAALWARRPESDGIPFGDMMLWSWVRHRDAERKLSSALRTLGMDDLGTWNGHHDTTAEQRVEALKEIARALDARTSYTIGHCQRVSKHAVDIGKALDLPDHELASLELAGLLHDVGNATLHEELFHKTGELTASERGAMEAHSLLGAQMAIDSGVAEVIEALRHHHERWDGEGYPEGLRFSAIPLFARVVAVAEAYDAMTSARPYRHGYAPVDAVAILRAESRGQFDPDVVEAFASTVRHPLTITQRFPALAAIAAQLREARLALRRVGAVTVSGAVSAIAIAIILGSTVLSPGTRSVQPQADNSPRRSRGDDIVLGAEIDGDLSSLTGADTEVPLSTTQVAMASATGPEATADSRTGGFLGASISGDTEGAAPGPGSGGSTDPDPTGPGSGETPAPEPSPTTPPADDDGTSQPAEEPAPPGKDKNPNSNGNGKAKGKSKGSDPAPEDTDPSSGDTTSDETGTSTEEDTSDASSNGNGKDKDKDKDKGKGKTIALN